MENDISIRMIQHFLYCQHRWGLIEINCSWNENYYVTKGNLIHKRVHNEDRGYINKEKKVLSSVKVYNDDLGIYGVLDSLELIFDENGVYISEIHRKCRLNIVEYKPTEPQNEIIHFDDLMQIYAQKKCVDFVFNCDSTAEIYYSNTKKRYKLKFDKGIDVKFLEVINTMREYKRKGIIPPISQEQKCSGCSMNDLCMPKLKKHKAINKLIFED